MSNQVNVPGEWAAFFMYLCVNEEKAWQRGLAGASVAEQLCRNLGMPYQRAQIIGSLDSLKFGQMTLMVDYREINELAKFSMWCREEIGYASFCFRDNKNQMERLNGDLLKRLTKCLREWRENFESYTDHVPEKGGQHI